MTIRFRLAAMFSIATAVALVIGGAIFVRSLEAGIRTSLDTSLLARADSLVQAVRDSPNGIDFRDSPGSKLLPARDAIRQILDPVGRVVEASQYAGTKPIVVSNAESQSGSSVRFSYATIEGDRHRILSTGVDRPDGHWTVIVAGSLEATEEATTQVRQSLIRGGVVAVLFAAAGSWLLARSALRPVERMRRFAEEISEHHTDAELPVPRTNDEIAALATTMNDLLGRLRYALRRQQAFVADAGHELRTPLAILRTELELADQPIRTRDELAEAIRNAAVETQRISRLAEELLFLARIDADGRKAHHRVESVPSIVQESVEQFRASATRYGVGLAFDSRVDLMATVDRTEIRRVVDNLIDNALRYSPSGSTISISVVDCNDAVRITVADRGPGFTTSFLPLAFERFSRANEARTAHDGGSGLGLSIVQAVARNHNGVAIAENVDGGGARVSVTIPLLAHPDERQRRLFDC